VLCVGLVMKRLLIAACALLALPGAALAQHNGGGGSHGGGGGGHGGGGGVHGGGGAHGQGGGHAGGGGFHGQGVGVRGGGFRSGGGYHSRFGAGSIGRFGARDLGAWRGGFWWHGFRGGRIGWWWLADGFWYWYDSPAYPYPDYVGDYSVPSDSYAPSDQVWYYCPNPGGYYPYVPRCPAGWQVVPADAASDGPP
jgi:hypothetical protein